MHGKRQKCTCKKITFVFPPYCKPLVTFTRKKSSRKNNKKELLVIAIYYLTQGKQLGSENGQSPIAVLHQFSIRGHVHNHLLQHLKRAHQDPPVHHRAVAPEIESPALLVPQPYGATFLPPQQPPPLPPAPPDHRGGGGKGGYCNSTSLQHSKRST